MTKGKIVIFMICVFCLNISAIAGVKKKLIHLGIDTPDINSLPKNINQMELTPFDGWVFCVRSKNPQLSVLDGRPRVFDFTWGGWGKRAFTRDEVQSSIDNLKKTKFSKFTDNFIRFCTTPGEVDWFESHDMILNNVSVAALIAKEGGMKGIFFDPEAYEAPIWDYNKQRDAKTKSYAEYAAQVRKRGAEVMNAFQKTYPDITILLAFGHSVNYVRGHTDNKDKSIRFPKYSNDPRKLQYCEYGLLSEFLNGMVEAAGPKAKLIDGFEDDYLSYHYWRAKEFVEGHRIVSEKVLPFVTDTAKYKKAYSCSFGVWLDTDWMAGLDRDNYPADGRDDYPGWSNKDFSRNYFQPEELEISLENALKYTDEYVWLYSERVFYHGPQKNIPDAYVEAISRARISCQN
jgi:hypothetical protein